MLPFSLLVGSASTYLLHELYSIISLIHCADLLSISHKIKKEDEDNKSAQ